jgi:5-methylcytosine-specific restriction endonuclease McrA
MRRCEALAAGSVFYDESRGLCPRGHTPILRYAITGKCVACTKDESRRYKAQRQAYAARNSETIVAKMTAWKTANPERVKVLAAEYKARHRKTISVKNKLYRETHPVPPIDRRVREARRRARKTLAGGSYTKDDVLTLMAMQAGKCAYCRKSIQKQYAVDHIIPVRLNGSSDRHNLQLLCRICNSSKGGKHPLDYAKTLGLLV